MLLILGVTIYNYYYILFVLHHLESLIWSKSGKKFFDTFTPPFS